MFPLPFLLNCTTMETLMKPYTANINPETGIAYGYISANALDSDLVTELMHGGLDHTREAAYAEWRDEKITELMSAPGSQLTPEAAGDIVDDRAYEFCDNYQDDEPTVEGVYQDVHYLSSWLGGALNFFISHSPYTTDRARRASPCVPNAGILDTLDGDVTSYDVPPSWRREED